MQSIENVYEAVRDCAQHYAEEPSYFEKNEAFMAWQWEHIIWPNISSAFGGRVLEIAAGYGRNTAFLMQKATEVWVTDVNESCVSACRKRFSEGSGHCRLHFLRTDGLTFGGVPSGAIDYVYSWDSMVHFPAEVLRANLHECARVLREGGRGFIHHANLSPQRADAYWKRNPGWRSAVDATMVAGFVQDSGLKLLRQICFSWAEVPRLDCMTLFSKGKPTPPVGL
jgi:ubiquinone/menaquinone biosynthesis C-methylase UbiE